jgi:hypothetical protein
MIRDFYRSLAPGARHWGDKNPHYAAPENAGVLETIAEMFPGARFVHIIRDGRDVVTSLIRKRHANGEPWTDFAGAHHAWTSHVDIGRRFGSTVPGQYFELRYEDLVGDDVGLARQLFEFLGIEIHPEVEKFCAEQAEERTPFSGPTRLLGATPNGSEWVEVLSSADQRTSLALLCEHLVAYGYETEESVAAIRQRLAGTSEP